MTYRFQGMAPLMTQAFLGTDLGPLGQQLVDLATSTPPQDNPPVLMDLSILLHLRGDHDLARSFQAQALSRQQMYVLPSRQATRLRLLAFMTPGDLSANTPLEFLIQNSDIELIQLYLPPDRPFPSEVPEHDVAFVAVGEADHTQGLLAALEAVLPYWPRPVLNRPARIARLSRDQLGQLLADAPDLYMPPSLRADRTILEHLGRCSLTLEQAYSLSLPVIVRPIDSHAGKGLTRIDSADRLLPYLETQPEAGFFLAPFVDYRSADGWFRKYRIAVVSGQPFAGHMALSDHWMIHYLNGGMTESPDKRNEEALFMTGFQEGFAARHKVALAGIQERLGLDYWVMDCAEMPDGRLLVFEIDSSAVIHDMDPENLFPYKKAPMRAVFNAFRELLLHTATQMA